MYVKITIAIANPIICVDYTIEKVLKYYSDKSNNMWVENNHKKSWSTKILEVNNKKIIIILLWFLLWMHFNFFLNRS